MLEPLLLGLSSGTVCLAFCAPVLVPYLLGEGGSIRRDAVVLTEFLLGRLAGYVLFALAAWLIGFSLLPSGAWRGFVFGPAYLVLSVLLIIYGFITPRSWCAARAVPPFAGASFLPLVLGFLTGINVCPPFLMALTRAADAKSALDSVRFFLVFFVGTAVYFVPMPLFGALGSARVLKTVGRLAAGIIGVYYLYVGLVTLYGGMRSL
jgi:sulfite exporter TauE/SafE